MNLKLVTGLVFGMAVLAPFQTAAVIVGFEGESGDTPPDKPGYRIQDDPEALGGQYIDSDHRDAKDPFGDFGVFRQYTFDLPAGTYDLWARIYTPRTFSYDPAVSDDPDSNNALFAYESDSFFVPSSLGGDPSVDLDSANRFASSGRFDGSGSPERANVIDAYAWINVSDGVDINGLPPSNGTLDTVTSYDSTGGKVSFTIMSREGGIRHDSFAFVTDGQVVTEEELDAAVLAASARTPMLVAVERVGAAGERIKIVWEATVGRKYAIDASRDLQNWEEVVATDLVAVSERATFERAVADLPLQGPQVYFRVREVIPPPALRDDFESGQGDWTIGVDDANGNTNWELGAPSGGVFGAPVSAHSGTGCFGTNLAGTYEVHANIWLRSPVIDLTAVTEATLTFFHHRDIETTFDAGSVRVLDAANLAELGLVQEVVEGTSVGWEQFSRRLPGSALGKEVLLEFRFQSDELAPEAQSGWYIDDVKVTVR